jgi:hypothetical protein
MVESLPAIRADDEEKKGMHRTECSGCIQYLNMCLKYAEFTGSVFMQITGHHSYSSYKDVFLA